MIFCRYIWQYIFANHQIKRYRNIYISSQISNATWGITFHK